MADDPSRLATEVRSAARGRSEGTPVRLLLGIAMIACAAFLAVLLLILLVLAVS
jgi:hypothetical protein